MGLKFLSLLFLLAAAAYAAPAYDEEELDDPFTAEEIDDAMDDESDVEDPLEDVYDEEEDPARRKKKKKKKYVPLFGAHAYCTCRRLKKKPKKAGDVEEDESSQDAVSDHIERIASDAALSDPKKSKKKAKKFAAFLKKLVGPYFASVNLHCYCTKNKAVIRLLRYLHAATIIHRRQKLAFWRRVRSMIAAVKMQKRG